MIIIPLEPKNLPKYLWNLKNDWNTLETWKITKIPLKPKKMVKNCKCDLDHIDMHNEIDHIESYWYPCKHLFSIIKVENLK